MTTYLDPAQVAGALLTLVPDISGEDTPQRPVPVDAGPSCRGCGTRAQRLWAGPGSLPLCTLCWLTLNLDSQTAAHGHLAWLPDASAADIINLQRRALLGLHSKVKAVRKESRKVWNWLARHAREVEGMWGTSRAAEFAVAMHRLSPAKRDLMQQRLEGCVLILPPDAFSDLTLLLPIGRTAENAVHTPSWGSYSRSDLYAKPPRPLD
ncbi:conjugal transfer protein [Lelliottia wanjuensis]|uniref:conjugal transfer protein n=1 Tax=Lelliottia wanjuensis TaxID=3050585 RepID=UPI00254B1AF3|nr:conjugal transfer protein [Lelliottia sp. V104_15]MDK9605880.1 conjugal transfer protein [Lelliottia sp. V104_15]